MPSKDYALRPQSEDQGFRDVVARMKIRMHQLDLNQSELGRRLGVTHAAVAGWMSLRFMPQFSILPRLPKILQCNGHWLLTGEGPVTERPDAVDLREAQGQVTALLQVRSLVEELLAAATKQAPAPTKSAPGASSATPPDA